jgi:hypothetical protein
MEHKGRAGLSVKEEKREHRKKARTFVRSISKIPKILDHALHYLKALEQLFKQRQARLIVLDSD